MVIDKQFWAGKRVFITGHTGFKGSWLSLWLQHLGAVVIGYATNPPTSPNMFESADVAHNMTSIIGDVRDQDSLTQAMSTAQPEIVIHMAAQPLVRYSYTNPVETYATNVMGSVYLFEAVRKTSEHRTALATARAGNVIGGGDWATDRIVPDIIRAINAGKPIRVRNPHAIRPWQHVLEPLSGYLLLAERLYTDGVNFSGAWNFGPNDADAKPVQWVVERLTSLWESGASWELDAHSQFHEAHYLKLDCSKAKAELGWHPHWDLDESLKNVTSWYKESLNGKNMRDITLQQIESFSSTGSK